MLMLTTSCISTVDVMLMLKRSYDRPARFTVVANLSAACHSLACSSLPHIQFISRPVYCGFLSGCSGVASTANGSPVRLGCSSPFLETFALASYPYRWRSQPPPRDCLVTLHLTSYQPSGRHHAPSRWRQVADLTVAPDILNCVTQFTVSTQGA